ncbi:MAG TPA: hypothetical protein VHU90_14265 [Galbitalea sp.]|jgi:beta-lactamase superfamily II metal-dependent hydrolase|nr:hypothetical protein [Galbitalea sp.]
MFYVRHGSENFTVIDCRLTEGDTMEPIIEEIRRESRDKNVVRFISTHPDDDHIKGIVELDDAMGFLNFYCVKNEATKPDGTDAFDHYCSLRDSDKAYYLRRGCRRKWMNVTDEQHGSAGIEFLWPVTENQEYRTALDLAASGGRANNISPIFTYSLNQGARMMWMGDLETKFMESIENAIGDFPQVDVLFAPHHGRDTPPTTWMDQIDPQIVVLGEAEEEHLDPYTGFTKMRQSRSGDLTFECDGSKIHIYATNASYSNRAIQNQRQPDRYGNYVGTIDAHG